MKMFKIALIFEIVGKSICFLRGPTIQFYMHALMHASDACGVVVSPLCLTVVLISQPLLPLQLDNSGSPSFLINTPARINQEQTPT